ncbi:MAG TPA: hypothetical protein VK186_09785 [Candidatus Deferrimicrobium sp.]|nr:hypothetical protein [Candidatus Kapabacteria bacterium]HLP59111.1 hypothetical protein [Candidatus Deferrimicrobium sp.]
MIKKNFDCVDMKHKNAAKIAQKISGLSPQQELEFWRTSTQHLLKSEKRLAKKRESISASSGL